MCIRDSIDTALCAWNGNIESKHAVVRYMKDHAREKDTAAWLAQEYCGSNSNSLFVVRAGSPEETQLPWPKVQRSLAQLIQEDRFYTEEEQDRFDNIDPIACLLYTSMPLIFISSPVTADGTIPFTMPHP